MLKDFPLIYNPKTNEQKEELFRDLRGRKKLRILEIGIGSGEKNSTLFLRNKKFKTSFSSSFSLSCTKGLVQCYAYKYKS
jgi:hypothetical protein